MNTPDTTPVSGSKALGWVAGIFGSLLLTFFGLTVSNTGRIGSLEGKAEAEARQLERIERKLDRLVELWK